MNIILSFNSYLKIAVFRVRLFLAAVFLHHEYEKNDSLQEFNALDGEDFMDVSVDV